MDVLVEIERGDDHDEEYLVTRSNDSSVIHGIVGLGLATAIFVDATIIRMVLVPATMKLMGAANRWILTWLDRLVQRRRISERLLAQRFVRF